MCREHAERHGWPVISVHQDQGISGAALGNRPGVQTVLGTLEAGDVLLVMELSRLSRSQDLAPLLLRLRHRGARVIGVQDGYDSESRTARMQAGLSGIMSEEFRTMVADRTRSALEMRAREGKPTGGKAYENVEIVREIFTRFADGESLKTIASDLNRRAVPSPGADWKPRARPRGRWLVSTIHEMLRNERYIGRLLWNRSQWVKDPDTGKRIRRERPESEWVVRDCERIIDDATWRRVQARFHTHLHRGAQPKWLLSGILECAGCGGKMIIMGGGQRRYVCGTYHAGGRHACANGSTFPRAIAERLILAPIIDDLLSPAAVAEGVRVMREQRAALRPSRAEVPDREVVELERLVRLGVLSPDVAAPAIEAARRKVQQRHAEDEPTQVVLWPSERAWREAVTHMRDVLQGDDIVAAREVLRDLIGPVRCHPAQDGYVVAELGADSIQLATSSAKTGTDPGSVGIGIRSGSGGSIRHLLARLPRHHRPHTIAQAPRSTGGR